MSFVLRGELNGDGGGSIKPEPHDVALSTANASHLIAGNS
jgi:hypothetical protein